MAHHQSPEQGHNEPTVYIPSAHNPYDDENRRHHHSRRYLYFNRNIIIVAIIMMVIAVVAFAGCARLDGFTQEAQAQIKSEQSAADTTQTTDATVDEASDDSQDTSSTDAKTATPATDAKTVYGIDQATLDQLIGGISHDLLPDALASQEDLVSAATSLAGHTVSDPVGFGISERDYAKVFKAIRERIVRSPMEAKMWADLFSITPTTDGTYLGADSQAVRNIQTDWRAALAVTDEGTPYGLNCFIYNNADSSTGYSVQDRAIYNAAGLLQILNGATIVDIGSGYENILNFHVNPTSSKARRTASIAGYAENETQTWIVLRLADKNGNSLLVDNGLIGPSSHHFGNGDGAEIYIGVNVVDSRIGLLKKATPKVKQSTTVRKASSSNHSYHYGYCDRDTSVVTHRITLIDEGDTVVIQRPAIVDNSVSIVDNTTIVNNSTTVVDNSTTITNIDNSTTVINDNDTIINDNDTTIINDNDTTITDIDIVDIDITDIDVNIDIDQPTPTPPTPPTPEDEEKDPDLDPVNNGNADQGGGQNQPTDGSGDLEPTDPANDQTQGHQDPETTHPDTPAPDSNHQGSIDNTNENQMNYEPVTDNSQTWTDTETGKSTTYTAPEEGQDHTPGAVEHGEFELVTESAPVADSGNAETTTVELAA